VSEKPPPHLLRDFAEYKIRKATMNVRENKQGSEMERGQAHLRFKENFLPFSACPAGEGGGLKVKEETDGKFRGLASIEGKPEKKRNK